jgi:hypothetical protein
MATEKINCQNCKYYYVTWDKRFPKGCRAYGIKTQYIPSVIVFRSTGKKCACYMKKN